MRYFLSTDNDCHHYLIPVDQWQAWDMWRDIPSEDERAWRVPDYTIEIGGSPSRVTFEKPEIDGVAVGQ